MTVRTFGRKGEDSGDRATAQRLEAFVAAERQRKQMATAPHGARAAIAMNAAPVPGEKSLAVAYVFWFFLGGLAGHRFYLGYSVSAALLAGLWVVSLMMLLVGFVGAVLTLAIAGFWLFTDALVLPGMHRKAVARQRELNRTYAPE